MSFFSSTSLARLKRVGQVIEQLRAASAAGRGRRSYRRSPRCRCRRGRYHTRLAITRAVQRIRLVGQPRRELQAAALLLLTAGRLRHGEHRDDIHAALSGPRSRFLAPDIAPCNSSAGRRRARPSSPPLAGGQPPSRWAIVTTLSFNPRPSHFTALTAGLGLEARPSLAFLCSPPLSCRAWP